MINAKITMKSVLNVLLLQHYITRALTIIPRELGYFSIMKTSIISKDFSFQ